MTEEEAKQKACCNGGCTPMANGPCIASLCMAWRWIMPVPTFQEVDPSTPITRNKTHGYKAPEPTHGYCGLAGKP